MKSNMNAHMKTLETFYRMENGYIKELESQLGTEKVRQLEAIGYIENAPSEKGYTFKMTNRAKRIAEGLYKRATLYDLVSDFYYTHIKRVNFAV